jgi:hypothetical protein
MRVTGVVLVAIGVVGMVLGLAYSQLTDPPDLFTDPEGFKTSMLRGGTVALVSGVGCPMVAVFGVFLLVRSLLARKARERARNHPHWYS